MTTRCKVVCSATTEGLTNDYNQPKNADGTYVQVEVQNATFYAVASSDPNSENAKFFASTPSISLSLSVLRGRPFEAGKEYYLDFVDVPATVPEETTAS